MAQWMLVHDPVEGDLFVRVALIVCTYDSNCRWCVGAAYVEKILEE